MIIVHDLMAQLCLSDEFKCQVLQWDGFVVPKKESSGLIGKTDPTSCDMRKVAIQTSETFSTREDTQRLVKIMDSAYVKVDLEQVSANVTKNNAAEIT